MRSIAPRTGAPEITLGEEQEDYRPLTVASYVFKKKKEDPGGSEGFLTRWSPNAEERKRIADGEDIYVMSLTFGDPLQPIWVQIGPTDLLVTEEDIDGS